MKAIAPNFRVHRTGIHLDITFGGRLDKEAMRRALDEFVAESEGIEHGTMLYRIDDFHLPTPGAIVLEFSRMPGMLRLMGRFRRCAILADKAWLRRVAEWEGKLFPGLEIKGFPRDQQSAAESWLTASV